MRFRVLAELGRSALGPLRMVRAESGRYNGRLFALQRFDPSVAKAGSITSSVLDEGWLTAVVCSRNVAQFIAWGLDEEGTYMALELVQGASLLHLLKAAAARRELIPDRLVGSLCAEICAGLWASHALKGPDGDVLGLAHGRLRPSTILVTFKGEVKIVELGLSAGKDRARRELGLDARAPEPAYTAPELARGGEADAKADLFSLGAILFELLTGKPPWASGSPEETARLVASEPPPDLGPLRKFCDPFFIALIRACLEKDPEQRLGNAGKIAELVAEWQATRGFGEGDQEALARFVHRCGAHQIDWFRRAGHGELAHAGSQSLEEALATCDFAVDPETRRALEAKKPSVPPPDAVPAARSSSSSFPAVSKRLAEEARSASLSPSAPDARAASAWPAARASVAPPSLGSSAGASGVGEGRSSVMPPSFGPPVASEGRPPASQPSVSARFSFVSRWAVGQEPASRDDERTRAFKGERSGPVSGAVSGGGSPGPLSSREPSLPVEGGARPSLQKAPITVNAGVKAKPRAEADPEGAAGVEPPPEAEAAPATLRAAPPLQRPAPGGAGGG